MNKLTAIFVVLLVTLLTTFSTQAFAAKDPIFTPRFNNNAIRGYDVVAYFTVGQPTKGAKEFSHEWMGANWHFSSAEHLELFMTEPEKYAPQYGGYCAWAMSQNKLAPIDPKQWSIVNDKLYLNYNKKIQNKWLKDQAKFISDADKNWPSVLNK